MRPLYILSAALSMFLITNIYLIFIALQDHILTGLAVLEPGNANLPIGAFVAHQSGDWRFGLPVIIIVHRRPSP
jgi:hypothetical protein